MRFIKPFIRVLKKQGMVLARLVYRGKEYRYSPEKGLEEAELQSVAIDQPEPVLQQETVSRHSEEKEIPSDKSQKRKTLISYRLTLVLLFLAVVLFVAVIVLNQRLSRKDIEPLNIPTADAGERGSAVKLPEKNNDITRGNEKKDLLPSGDEKRKGETVSPQTEKKTGVISDRTDLETGKGDMEKKDADEPEPYQQAVSIRNVSPELIEAYHSGVNTLRIELPRKVTVSGYYGINLSIDKNGKVYLFGTNDSGIEVKPDSRRDRVILRLKQMIAGLQFKPPRDRHGRSVRVENWRLNYLVTQFKRRLVLRKQ